MVISHCKVVTVDEVQRVDLTKRQARVVAGLIERWLREGTLTAETAERLTASYHIAPFNWRRLARIAVLTSVICFVVAVASLLADELILRLLARLFEIPATALCVVFAIFAAGLYAAGFYRRKRKPERVFTNEGLLFLGVLSTAVSIFYLGAAIGGGEDFSLLLLLACGIYGALGLSTQSKLIWIFALLSLGGWFGAETGYVSGWGAYYLGMNYPLRFVAFGLVLCAVSYPIAQVGRVRALTQSTLTMGLLYLFISLWIMSIFGNYGDPESWERAKQIELFHWSLLFALAAGAAIWRGLKFDNTVSHGFGITFLFINLYTRFFEHFWDTLHKAIFFAILGASLWILGAYAQKIWNLGRRRELREERLEPPPT